MGNNAHNSTMKVTSFVSEQQVHEKVLPLRGSLTTNMWIHAFQHWYTHLLTWQAELSKLGGEKHLWYVVT